MTQFELFDFQDECKTKLQEIRQKPIILKIGKYECWVENESIHYSKWIKKQIDLTQYKSVTHGWEEVRYYKDGKFIFERYHYWEIEDQNGKIKRIKGDFPLYYWENKQITKEDFLDNSPKT